MNEFLVREDGGRMTNRSRDPECPHERQPLVYLITPRLEDLWFRQQMMADPNTMSYNHAWGGSIPFPENQWPDWYDHWVLHPEGQLAPDLKASRFNEKSPSLRTGTKQKRSLAASFFDPQ